MTSLEAVLRRVAADLEELGARFAIVGGIAVSVRTEPRFTRDLDLAVAVGSDREAEALVGNLLRRGYRVLAQVEQEAANRLAALRLAPPAGVGTEGVVVDMLFASSGIEADVVEGAELVEAFPGFAALVAGRGHLLALKVLAREATRPQDDADIRQLLAVSGPAEIQIAREALRRIGSRGFHRKKDLLAELEAFLRKGSI